jgi:hypothetical protein
MTFIPLPTESNGAVPVNIQDQHTLALDLNFLRSLNATTLTSDASPDDRVLNVTSVTDIAAGTVIGLGAGTGAFYFGTVVSVSTLALTMDTLIDSEFLSASTVVIVADKHLNTVAGSAATPIIYQIGPIGPAIVVDITRIMGTIIDDVAMDDGKFGGIDALTNGIALRLNNGVISNHWNAKTNGDLGLICFDSAYTDKAPAGENGFRFRNTYAGPSKHGVTLRLMAGEILEILIQDDLTGLTDFQMMAQGHVVSD